MLLVAGNRRQQYIPFAKCPIFNATPSCALQIKSLLAESIHATSNPVAECPRQPATVACLGGQVPCLSSVCAAVNILWAGWGTFLILSALRSFPHTSKEVQPWGLSTRTAPVCQTCRQKQSFLETGK